MLMQQGLFNNSKEGTSVEKIQMLEEKITKVVEKIKVLTEENDKFNAKISKLQDELGNKDEEIAALNVNSRALIR